jgi:hypothetical protein
MKMEIIGQAVCIFNIATSKAAVGFFLLRILAKNWHKACIWFLMVTNSLLAIWTTIAVFIQCIPVESVWNATVKGNCWLDFAKVGLTCSGTVQALYFVQEIIVPLSSSNFTAELCRDVLTRISRYAAYAVCVDFIFALAPCVVVWELQMKRKDKLITVGALSLGIL